MKKVLFRTVLLGAFCVASVVFAHGRPGSSCYSQPGTISANIQVFYADKVDEPVVFDASRSTGIGDFFKQPIDWDFGDGFEARMCRATHVYRDPGTYVVTLTVRDNAGTPSTTTGLVTVSTIAAATGRNILRVVADGSLNGRTTFHTIQEAVNAAATLNASATVEIIIPAGLMFVENLELKVPVGNNYITLRSSALENLPRQQRVDRSHLSNFPTIKSPLNNENLAAVRTELRAPGGGPCFVFQTCEPAHHYRLQGIQMMVEPGTYSGPSYEQILAIGTDNAAQNEAAEQPHHIIVDRCLVYREDYSPSNPNPQGVKNGIEADGQNLSILDSYISGINLPGVESHGINAYNSTGVWGIVNNYLEAGSVNFLVGGALPLIPGARVDDVEFRRNRCHKPLEKRALPTAFRWPAKNNFEIKNGRNYVIRENLFDGNWVGSNQRTLVVFASYNDTDPNPSTGDIEFSYNVLRQGPDGVLIARDVISGPSTFTRFLVSYNLLTQLGGPAYGQPRCRAEDCETEGQGLRITTIPTSLAILHNTFLVRKTFIQLAGTSFQAILLRDNIANHGEIYQDGWGYGIIGDLTITGCPGIDFALPGCDHIQAGIAYLPNSTFEKNIIAGMLYDSRYPGNAPYPFQSTNYYFPTQTPREPAGFANINNHFVNRAAGNYRIVSGSPGKNGASDRTDVGANIDITEAVAASAVSGIWPRNGL